MSQFVVSARKYRPLRFDDVIGQEHVSKTLKNAIQQNTLAHAFLFCGPRGVGKTTCARILAKVLNCKDVSPETEPCGNCPSCKAFEKNASLNIIELDAASNNSVEHIRSLIEQVRFQPQEGDYKIFIIDEVHMLSQQAFNAFLKTLEEPPPYAIFILATTEKHKIIPTILSRCQIFDFKRIDTSNMVEQLFRICKEEGIEAESEALHLIAQKADGALRDSLSIFDKLSSFGGKKITYRDVIDNLNILDYDYYFQMVDAFLEGDVGKVLSIFDEIQRKGFEGDIFINGLAEHVRNLLVCKHQAIHHLLSISEQLQKRYFDQSKMVEESFLLSMLDIANDCDINYKMAKNKRLHVELALIKINYLTQMVEIDSSHAVSVEKKSPPSSKIQNEPENQEKEPATTPLESSITESGIKSTPKSEKTKHISPEAASDQDNEMSGTSFELAHTEPVVKSPFGSLKAFVKAVEEKNERDEKIVNKVINIDEVQETWNAYAAEQPSQSVKAVLTNTSLHVKNNAIVATVGSNMSKAVILQETDLIERLREALGVPRLTIKIEIDDDLIGQSETPKILTTKEKYELLCEENPAFLLFQKKFDLKIDHD